MLFICARTITFHTFKSIETCAVSHCAEINERAFINRIAPSIRIHAALEDHDTGIVAVIMTFAGF